MQNNQSDKRLEESFEHVKFLMKLEHTDHMTIDYDRLDGITQNELKMAISKVLHKRYNELSTAISGNGEFVVHNG
jgi:hypothetical protein